ncbi:hypothetical protein K440DRAFT_617562 [Wilcoxina mikolae CBS 423.85]|nr:hypothetical protein K440DRAFT_617562 [Wilcoxina mikolae CBS 423.85]
MCAGTHSPDPLGLPSIGSNTPNRSPRRIRNTPEPAAPEQRTQLIKDSSSAVEGHRLIDMRGKFCGEF